MTDCDIFEQEYQRYIDGTLPKDSAARLDAHRRSCSHCGVFDQTGYRLRETLRKAPIRQPRVGFEMRLDYALADRGRGSRATSRQAVPKWAAISAGLATGLALGAFLLIAPRSSDKSGGVQPFPSAQIAARAQIDSSADRKDSLKESTEYYSADGRSRLVSGR